MAVRLDPNIVPSNEEMAMYTPVIAEDLILAMSRGGFEDCSIVKVEVDDQDEATITLRTPGIIFDIKITINDFE